MKFLILGLLNSVKMRWKCGKKCDYAAWRCRPFSIVLLMLTCYLCKYRLFFAYSISPLAPLWNQCCKSRGGGYIPSKNFGPSPPICSKVITKVIFTPKFERLLPDCRKSAPKVTKKANFQKFSWYRIFLKMRYFGQKNSHRIKFE